MGKLFLFEDWQRGGMTHYKDCWKGHLVCALAYATELLDHLVGFVEEEHMGPTDEERAFLDYIETNK